VGFLLRDRDAKFCRSFDEVSGSESAEIIRTPVQAPTATPTRSVGLAPSRAECMDWPLIVGRSHLERVLRVYVRHYNQHRPHRALGLQAPDQSTDLIAVGEDRSGRLHRRDLLGGLVHQYRRAA
jgi:putative transposase